MIDTFAHPLWQRLALVLAHATWQLADPLPLVPARGVRAADLERVRDIVGGPDVTDLTEALQRSTSDAGCVDPELAWWLLKYGFAEVER